MPLQRGSSQETISKNIAELVSGGKYSVKQAAAIAYRVAGEAKDDMADDAFDALAERVTTDCLASDESMRVPDSFGRMFVKTSHITKACVSPYYGHEIPGGEELGLDPNRIYKMLRAPDELQKPETLASANGIQVLIVHEPVSADDPKSEIVSGTTGTNAVWNDPYIDNELSIWTQEGIDLIEDEKQRELSACYSYKPDMTPGTFGGEPYDGVMRDIRFNHIAQVEKGRAGSDVLVADAALPQPLEEHSMAKKPVRKPVISRFAARTSGALTAYLTPRLAADAKLDLNPLFKGVTAKNWATKKADVIKAAFDAAEPLMTPEAKAEGGAGPDDVIMRVLDMVQGQVAPEEAEADETGDAEVGGAGDPASGEVASMDGEGDDDKDKQILAFLKDKLGEDDMAECLKMMGKAAPEPKRAADGDGEGDEESKVSKQAMDAALAANSRATEERITNRFRAAAEAREFVRDWVGHLSMAYDSAPDIYRAALKGLGVDCEGVHDDALKPILKAQPKPGEKRQSQSEVTMDAAQADSYFKRFPNAERLSAH